ncbi:STAS domain-containing protein [Paraburkholderia madseniana]|uniref:STAS domain-containing protein n=1 Tax=Paraburkholderia madseniana TaxID=2599607 RepID=A0A6N6W6D0_9BURK|nr:STAS domain-containing protein [Paraburkholderia madseniana]KAE8755334.1 STAS domain-containing protein [Paraburkholderia madseniana]
MTSRGTVQLDGELTIYRVLELKDTLLVALRGVGALTVDLSAVTAIDSAGVQLLVAAQRMAAEKGQVFRIVDCSSTVAEVFALFDITALFDEHPSDAGLNVVRFAEKCS